MENNLPAYRTPEDARLAAEANEQSTTVGFYGDRGRAVARTELDVLSGLPEGLGDLMFDRSMCGGGYQLRGVKPVDHDRLVAYIQACRPGHWVRSYPEVHVVAWQR